MMIKHPKLLSMVTGLALSAACLGCQSAAMTARGQSPHTDMAVPPPAPLAQGLHDSIEAIHQEPHMQTLHQGVRELRQNYLDHHAQTTTFYYDVQRAGPGATAGYCPPAAPCPGGACPSGYCPVHGPCPSGMCFGCSGWGNGLDWYPKHHASYSYNRPSDLVYPPAHVPGGAVVYPYYTVKGPSDFFRD